MKFRNAALLLLAVLIAVGIGAWLGTRSDKHDGAEAPQPVPAAVPQRATAPLPPTAATPPQPPASAPATTSPPAAKPITPVVPAPVVPSPAVVPMKRDADFVVKAREEIEKISFMLRDFRTLMGGNPVGSNAEIMKSVNGGNPKGARLGPPEGQQLNEQGELVDDWGTPYFFHQMSATHMEIRSAGPDKKLNTADDIVGR